MDFKDEVCKAACNAFQQGFTKANKKVGQTFPRLDLTSIIAIQPKLQVKGKEEWDETRVIEEVTEGRDAMVAEVGTTKEAGRMDIMESTREVADAGTKGPLFGRLPPWQWLRQKP